MSLQWQTLEIFKQNLCSYNTIFVVAVGVMVYYTVIWCIRILEVVAKISPK